VDDGGVELAGAESCALDSVLDDVDEPVAANAGKDKQASKNGSRKNLIGFPEGGIEKSIENRVERSIVLANR
jgi:hypothetical protein